MGIEGLMMATQLCAPRGRDTGLTSLLQAAKEIICVGYCVLNTGEEEKKSVSFDFPFVQVQYSPFIQWPPAALCWVISSHNTGKQ